MSHFSRTVLTVREFYLLFLTRMGFTMITNSVPTYYKAFALTFIDDDKFITTAIGTMSGQLRHSKARPLPRALTRSRPRSPDLKRRVGKRSG